MWFSAQNYVDMYGSVLDLWGSEKLDNTHQYMSKKNTRITCSIV